MANADKAAVVAKLAAAPYAAEFRRLFGDNIFADVEGATCACRSPSSSTSARTPSSTPTAASTTRSCAARGLARRPGAARPGALQLADQGQLRRLPSVGRGADGAPPLFTDFSYDNLGVPRNPELARNADPAYFDLGLCQRADLAGRGDLCGAFKVPSLRNVALRQAFFHNGRFKTLKDALTFYVQRDTNPEKFYPLDGDGTVPKFDDLPPEYRANVNTSEVPYNRGPATRRR